MEEQALVHDEPVPRKSVNLIVGGVYYSLCAADIELFPDSYFAHLFQPHWTKDNSVPVKIDRCGELFRYIYFYIYTKVIDLPSRKVEDFNDLLSLRAEADFYNLPELTQICDGRINDILKEWCQKKLPHLDVYPLYDCVQDAPTESEEPEDALLKAVRFIRPPCVATTTSRTVGNMSHQPAFYERNSYKYSSETGGSYTAYNLTKQPGLRKVLSVCPFTGLNLESKADHTNISMQLCRYEKGDFCAQQTLGYYGYFGDSRMGSILCIINSEYTGGKVTTQVHGKTYSIEKPGECLALQLGCSYTVETVTSGTLALLEYSIYSANNAEKGKSALKWTHPGSIAPVGAIDSVYDGIQAALATEFERYEGVVVCLANLYPVQVSFEAHRRFETAPNSFTDSEIELESFLAQYYDVDVVTVAITVANDYRTVVGACVLDYISTLPGTVQDASSSGAVNESQVQLSAKYKIVAPLFGLGRKFTYHETSSWAEHKSTLLTAMMITKKVKV